MKRIRVYEKLISDENLEKAIKTVCRSHRWCHYPDKPNKTVIWLESDIKKRVNELREMIEGGFEPSEAVKKRRYDNNAGKWREISEPKLWPDQCVHHAIIQVLESVMMRGMNNWCCGSIKGRGAHYGIHALKKWRKHGKEKWCVELDIRHFYDSLEPKQVIGRLKSLLKDHKTLDLIERVIRNGIQIGAYCSQWFANTFLQPLDRLIRTMADRYVRYMDNFTIMTRTKKAADRIIEAVGEWLKGHGLKLKDNWQKFRMSKRLPNALGYRFGKGYTIIRKKNLLRLRRQVRRFYKMREKGRFVTMKFAQGLLSRFGQLRHCNSVKLYTEFPKHTQRKLKNIIREEAKKWSTYLEQKQVAEAL